MDQQQDRACISVRQQQKRGASCRSHLLPTNHQPSTKQPSTNQQPTTNQPPQVGLTNVYTAQLFYNQQQLQPNTVAALRKAVPALTDDDVAVMQRVPHRSFSPEVLQVGFCQ